MNGKVPGPPVALSTSSVYPERTPDAFELAARLGYDGVEVMVYTDPVSQEADALRRLSDYHQLPIVSVHAPNLLLAQRVWGRAPWEKLRKAQELAERVGARVVVLHPPFRWQRDYVRGFETGLAAMAEETDVIFAVENMYQLHAGASEVVPYAPHWDPTALDVPNVTLDLSHTAASGSSALIMATELGSRLAHVHLADGAGSAGAAVVHVHIRDGAAQPTLDVGRLTDTVAALRAGTGLIVQLSTGGAVTDPFDRRLAVLDAGPDACSLTCGTVNFGDDVFMNPW